MKPAGQCGEVWKSGDKFKKHFRINQIWNEKNLKMAWKRVKENKGGTGIDRVTIQGFENNLPQNLTEIQRLPKEKCYTPNPVKRVLIPKDNGKMRPLGIPTVRDRVIQQAPQYIRYFLLCSTYYL